MENNNIGNNLFNQLGIDSSYIIIGLCVLTLILLIIVIVCITKLNKLTRNYDYFMRGKDAESLEDFIIGISEEVHRLQNEDRGAKDTIRSINRNLRASYQKFGLVRYNAFKGLGGNLSFASEDRLEKYLGLKQGSVSPFGLMNDTDHAVEFFIDKDLSRCKSLGVHPLENTATVFLSFKDLDKFLWDLDVDVIKVKL